MDIFDVHYEKDPVDYCISSKDLVRIFSTRNHEQIDIKIDDEEFSFVQMTTVDKGIQYSYTCSSGKTDHAFLLKEIFQGDKITIDIDNYAFLYKVAVLLQIKDLEVICDKYQNKGYLEPSAHSIFRNILKWCSSFLRNCAIISKVFLTLWDVIGVGVVLGFFTNSIILIITMAIYTVQQSPFIFLAVMLPLSVYSFFFVNVMLISIWEFFKFQMFRIQSPWGTCQQLCMKFIKVTKWNRPNLPLYYDMSYAYNIILGIGFVIFCITFVSQVSSKYAADWIAGYIFLNAIILPTCKYLLIILEYTIHGFASCFEYCRKRYIDCDDFEDPFLNAMYFRDRPYTDLFNALRDNGDKNEYSDSQSETVSQKEESTEDDSFEDLESREDSFIDNQESTNIGKLFIRAIFSRNTFTIFAMLCLIIYLIVEYVNTSLTAAQGVCIVFGFECVVGPLTSFLVFPFFWLSRQFHKPMTKARLALEREDLHTESDYQRYTYDLVIWDNKYSLLRWSSIVITFCVCFIFFIFIIFCIAIAENPNYFNEQISGKVNLTEPSKSTKAVVRDTWFNPTVPPKETLDFRSTTNPICFTKVKGLSSEQVMALAASSYYNEPDEVDEFHNILKEFFGQEWDQHMEVIESPFPESKYKISLTHFKFPSLNLIVFAIKGTSNLNEVLADIELWCSSVIFDILFKFTPMIETYASSGRVMLEWVMSMPRFAFKQFSLVNLFVDTFTEYIESVDIPEDYDVLITGHSLGGGLSKIISLRTGYQAFSISGPGVKTVQSFYGTEKTKDIMSTFINVVPAQDYVSMVDTSYSQTKYFIPCRSGFIKCHSSARTICQTNILCGNKEDHEKFCRKLFPNDSDYKEMIELGSPIHIQSP